MPQTEELMVQEEEQQFPIGKAQGAPSDDMSGGGSSRIELNVVTVKNMKLLH
jgi:hypothetical protein